MRHESNDTNDLRRAPLRAVHVAPKQVARPFLLRDGSDAFQAKIARKAAARDALGYGRGGAGKLDVLADRLREVRGGTKSVSAYRSLVGRCLSLDPRDPEFSPDDLRALGVLDAVRAADPIVGMGRAA